MTPRALTTVALAALFAILATGAALAASKTCFGNGTFCFGTLDDDEIFGSPTGDRIQADGGNDLVFGGDGDDEISGDTSVLRGGDDQLFGGPGADRVRGFAGRDRLVGGPGRDTITAVDQQADLPRRDIVRGGPGGDLINAVDGQKDIIDCGGGKDVVDFDRRLDEVAADCEEQSPERVD